MRLELTRSNDHYPLKVARLPIPPSGHYAVKSLKSSKAWSENIAQKILKFFGRKTAIDMITYMVSTHLHAQKNIDYFSSLTNITDINMNEKIYFCVEVLQNLYP